MPWRPPNPRYVCVRCGKDWTTDLENIANSPTASIDALCECHQLIVVEGADSGVFLIEGLGAKGQASVSRPQPGGRQPPAVGAPQWRTD